MPLFGHTALNVVGFNPGVGSAAELANAARYAHDGDHADATLSGITANPRRCLAHSR